MQRGRHLPVERIDNNHGNPGIRREQAHRNQSPTPSGVKTVRVRFPSDDEWIGRQRRRKVLVRQLGRGVSETTVANGEDVDAAPVAKVRAGAIDAMDTAFRGGPGRRFLAGQWPDDPSFRFLVHWALRRDELCDPGLVPDAPEDDQRCDHCPLA